MSFSTSVSANTEAIQTLVASVAVAKAQISTDIKTLCSRLDKLQALEPEDEEEDALMCRKQAVEEEQMAVLEQCLTICQAAADSTSTAVGHSYSNSQLFGEASAIYGDVGDVPMGSARHRYNGNRAQDRARVIMGNVDAASFHVFMN